MLGGSDHSSRSRLPIISYLIAIALQSSCNHLASCSYRVSTSHFLASTFQYVRFPEAFALGPDQDCTVYRRSSKVVINIRSPQAPPRCSIPTFITLPYTRHVGESLSSSPVILAQRYVYCSTLETPTPPSLVRATALNFSRTVTLAAWLSLADRRRTLLSCQLTGLGLVLMAGSAWG